MAGAYLVATPAAKRPWVSEVPPELLRVVTVFEGAVLGEVVSEHLCELPTEVSNCWAIFLRSSPVASLFLQSLLGR